MALFRYLAVSSPSTHGSDGASPVVAMALFTSLSHGSNMELTDRIFSANRDWDPSYLRYIFSQDFYEFHDLWHSNVCDKELVKEAERTEHYSPVVEDISMDDDTLYEAVAQIEHE